MEKCVILVDNSNVFIEGGKHSARRKGVTRRDPTEKDPCDPSWRINFGVLVSCLAKDRKIHAAILVGSRPPKNDSVWESARQNGFEVTVYDRGASGQEKAVDTELVARGTEIICTVSEPMILIIASGDRDFIPLVNVAHRKGWEVEMWAFSAAFKPDGAMASTVDRIEPLDTVFSEIGYYGFTWPIQEE